MTVADWNAVVLAARRQRVIGLVYDALLAAGVELPAAPAAEFARRAQAISRRNLLLATETFRLQKLLDAAAIPSVALKGVALAQLAYGSLKLKHTRDIDLLIPPATIYRSRCIMSALAALHFIGASRYVIPRWMARHL